MIAISLACDPDILIADEATAAFDVTIQAQILTQLAGTTYVVRSLHGGSM